MSFSKLTPEADNWVAQAWGEVGKDGDHTISTQSVPVEALNRLIALNAVMEKEVERLTAGLESVERLCRCEVDGEPAHQSGGAQAYIVLQGSNRPLERTKERIAKLENALRELDDLIPFSDGEQQGQETTKAILIISNALAKE